MKSFLLVFLGGGLGSIARYALHRFYTLFNFTFPFATLTANFLSCFIVGIMAGIWAGKDLDNSLKLLVITGFCGGFSTFSAFAFESNQLWQGSGSGMAILNILLNFALGVSALYLGSLIARVTF